MRCHHINVRAILKACGQFYTMKILKNEKTSKVIVAIKIAIILESISKWEIVWKKFKNKKNEKREVRFSLCRIARLLKKIARTLMWWQHIFNTTNFLIPNTFSYFLILNTFSYFLMLSHTFSTSDILSHT